MGIPGGEEKAIKTECKFKAIMPKNFPDLRRKMDVQIHKAQGTPNRLRPNRATLRYITIKLSNVKENSESSKKKREVT